MADADVVIASENAWFTDPHVSVGQVSGIEPASLALRVPLNALALLALAGRSERWDAQRALELGLVTEVVAPERLLERDARGRVGDRQELPRRGARHPRHHPPLRGLGRRPVDGRGMGRGAGALAASRRGRRPARVRRPPRRRLEPVVDFEFGADRRRAARRAAIADRQRDPRRLPRRVHRRPRRPRDRATVLRPARVGAAAHARLAGRVRRARRLGLGPDRRARGDVGAPRAARRAVHGAQLGRPGDHGVRHRRAEGPLPPRHRRRAGDLVPGLQRARRRVRPRVAEHEGDRGRRRLADQRPEDLDVVRAGWRSAACSRRASARASRSTRASRSSSSRWTRRGSPCGRSAAHSARITSTRCSSTTSSSTTAPCSAASGHGWQVIRHALDLRARGHRPVRAVRPPAVRARSGARRRLRRRFPHAVRASWVRALVAVRVARLLAYRVVHLQAEGTPADTAASVRPDRGHPGRPTRRRGAVPGARQWQPARQGERRGAARRHRGPLALRAGGDGRIGHHRDPAHDRRAGQPSGGPDGSRPPRPHRRAGHDRAARLRRPRRRRPRPRAPKPTRPRASARRTRSARSARSTSIRSRTPTRRWPRSRCAARQAGSRCRSRSRHALPRRGHADRARRPPRPARRPRRPARDDDGRRSTSPARVTARASRDRLGSRLAPFAVPGRARRGARRCGGRRCRGRGDGSPGRCPR